MIHIAYMKKSWGMIPKILSGEKTIESRWYKTKRAPWGKIKAGETIYFKNSGESVTAQAKVHKVQEYKSLKFKSIKRLLNKYGKQIGVGQSFYKMIKDKKYCILIFLENPKRVEPFEINKNGFGAMSAWITTDDISKICWGLD